MGPGIVTCGSDSSAFIRIILVVLLLLGSVRWQPIQFSLECSDRLIRFPFCPRFLPPPPCSPPCLTSWIIKGVDACLARRRYNGVACRFSAIYVAVTFLPENHKTLPPLRHMEVLDYSLVDSCGNRQWASLNRLPLALSIFSRAARLHAYSSEGPRVGGAVFFDAALIGRVRLIHNLYWVCLH